jgi:REP-associated tyrosine transposase
LISNADVQTESFSTKQGCHTLFLGVQSLTIYDTAKHTIYYHRFYFDWIAKYRFKVLRGEMCERIREIARQVCGELGVTILSGVLSSDHVHIFIGTAKLAISDLKRAIKGWTSRKIQQELGELRKRCWECRFLGSGYFSTTYGQIADDIILQYIDKQPEKTADGSRSWFSKIL